MATNDPGLVRRGQSSKRTRVLAGDEEPGLMHRLLAMSLKKPCLDEPKALKK